MVAAGSIASEPVEKGGEDSQRATHDGGVARVVVVADRQSEVIERGQRVAVLGLEAGQTGRQVVSRWRGCRCLGRSPGPGAGRPARGRDRRRGRRSRRRTARTRAHTGCGWLRRRRSGRSRRPSPPQPQPATVSARTRHALVNAWVSRPRASWARHHSTAPFGLADDHVRSAKPALDAERHLVAATGDHHLAGVAVADSRLDPSGQCSTATPSHTGTRAGDGRRRGRAR